MNAVGYFEIQASDPARAIAFYEQVFGWRFHNAGDKPIDYWDITEAGIRGGLLGRPVPGVRWQGYFQDTEATTFGIFQPDEAAA